MKVLGSGFRSYLRTAVFAGALLSAWVAALGISMAEPESWRAEWPRTDFSRHTVPLEEIKSGGPPKDGIPSIDAPRFERHRQGRSHRRCVGTCKLLGVSR